MNIILTIHDLMKTVILLPNYYIVVKVALIDLSLLHGQNSNSQQANL